MSVLRLSTSNNDESSEVGREGAFLITDEESEELRCSSMLLAESPIIAQKKKGCSYTLTPRKPLVEESKLTAEDSNETTNNFGSPSLNQKSSRKCSGFYETSSFENKGISIIDAFSKFIDGAIQLFLSPEDELHIVKCLLIRPYQSIDHLRILVPVTHLKKSLEDLMDYGLVSKTIDSLYFVNLLDTTNTFIHLIQHYLLENPQDNDLLWPWMGNILGWVKSPVPYCLQRPPSSEHESLNLHDVNDVLENKCRNEKALSDPDIHIIYAIETYYKNKIQAKSWKKYYPMEMFVRFFTNECDIRITLKNKSLIADKLLKIVFKYMNEGETSLIKTKDPKKITIMTEDVIFKVFDVVMKIVNENTEIVEQSATIDTVINNSVGVPTKVIQSLLEHKNIFMELKQIDKILHHYKRQNKSIYKYFGKWHVVIPAITSEEKMIETLREKFHKGLGGLTPYDIIAYDLRKINSNDKKTKNICCVKYKNSKRDLYLYAPPLPDTLSQILVDDEGQLQEKMRNFFDKDREMMHRIQNNKGFFTCQEDFNASFPLEYYYAEAKSRWVKSIMHIKKTSKTDEKCFEIDEDWDTL